jgi:hypothetical protein
MHNSLNNFLHLLFSGDSSFDGAFHAVNLAEMSHHVSPRDV